MPPDPPNLETPHAWKHAVAQAFGRAEAYEEAARIQAIVAERLAASIAGQALPPAPRTLEIGCGTGLLTRALRSRLDLGPTLATDIAPTMLARCRDRLGSASGVRFAAMDGERPCVTGGFDLIASSLAAQWFVDLPGALGRLAALLDPGGLLAVATLAAGTFHEWEQAQESTGGTAASRVYPSVEALREMRFAGCSSEVRLDILHEDHTNGAAFLGALRAIGANTPTGAARIRSAGTLRRALRAFEARGASVTYAVATCLIRRSARPEA